MQVIKEKETRLAELEDSYSTEIIVALRQAVADYYYGTL